MTMRFTELPKYIPLSVYEEQLGRMVDLLKRHSNVISIYQVGSVGTPGISDVDLWIIFKDGTNCDFNHRDRLDANGQYVFTHGLFGICQSHFRQAQRFPFFHDFKHLFGDDLRPMTAGKSDFSDSDIFVERQSALEYVINAYQVYTVERAFGVLSVRNLLLYAKALLMDLAPLGVERKSNGLKEALERLIDVRGRWFNAETSVREIPTLYEEYGRALRRCLNEYFLQGNEFWHPTAGRVELRGNMVMRNGAALEEIVSGPTLPAWITARHKRIRNLQRRFVRFEFVLPMSAQTSSTALGERFELICRAQEYNRAYLPHFMPLPVGLDIFESTRNMKA